MITYFNLIEILLERVKLIKGYLAFSIKINEDYMLKYYIREYKVITSQIEAVVVVECEPYKELSKFHKVYNYIHKDSTIGYLNVIIDRQRELHLLKIMRKIILNYLRTIKKNIGLYLLGFFVLGLAVNLIKASNLGSGAWDTVYINLYALLNKVMGYTWITMGMLSFCNEFYNHGYCMCL